MKQRLQPHRVPRQARTRVLHRSTLMIAVVWGISHMAVAQDKPPASENSSADSSQLSEVVVTGSRVARSTFTTPNPVTVLNSKDIENLGLVNVGDVLGELPQNSNFFAANNVGLGNFNVGAQLANLRGLNPFFGTRTLTMVDTQRVVPQATGGGVDVTLIPSMLVARTEVVTGGASAVYGSDAVAGVVNIILDKKLSGLKVQADYGQTSHHDGGDTHFSFGYGNDLLGDRAHYIIGAEYENSEDIGICSQVRDWCKSNEALYTNSLYAGAAAANGRPAIPPNGLPHYIIGPNGTAANTSQTGVLTPCTLPSSVCIPTGPQYIFNSAGTGTSVFNPGNYPDGAGPFGFSQGAGATGVGAYDGTTLKPSTKRYTGLAYLDFKINDSLDSFLQVNYARSFSTNPVANGALGPLGLEVARGVFVPLSPGVQISAGNPYLPAQFQPGGANALAPSGPIPPPFCAPAPSPCGNSIGGALLGYNMNGILPARNQTDNDTIRITGGLSGAIGKSTWSWDSYFEYGQNNNNQALFNSTVASFLAYAIDAVKDPATGNVVCRATLPGPAFNAAATGCVPINLFGAGNASQAALHYAFRTLVEYSTLDQAVLSANIHGDLFSGIGAGPFKASFGAEARRDTANVTHDLNDQPWYDSYVLSYGLDYAGKISVIEGYGEVDAPLLRDLPLAKYLDVDVAFRETNNKNEDETNGSATDGESVTHNIASWKLSSIWDLTDWFRVRGTRSRDVRAAGFRELYESYAVSSGGPFGQIVNPSKGQNQIVTALTGGNINLEPEKADTTTFGFVISPKSGPLERFQFSADWYRIVINDPITGPPFGLGVQNIVNLCSAGQQAFCDRVIFAKPGGFAANTATGDITINNTAVNLGHFETRGVDFETSYALPLQDLSSSLHGDLNFRLLTSLLYNMTVDNGLGSGGVDYAGQTGPTAAFGNFNTSPRWQSNFFLTYGNGPLSATLQVRWIGRGTFETLTAVGGSPIQPGDPGYSPTSANSINSNNVASATYLNLSASYDFTQHFSAFMRIDNLLNKDPPIAPGGNGYPTNPVYFDTYGMTWKVGVRAKF
jgi:iron complex outermembrane recepter protein